MNDVLIMEIEGAQYPADQNAPTPGNGWYDEIHAGPHRQSLPSRLINFPLDIITACREFIYNKTLASVTISYFGVTVIPRDLARGGPHKIKLGRFTRFSRGINLALMRLFGVQDAAVKIFVSAPGMTAPPRFTARVRNS